MKSCQNEVIFIVITVWEAILIECATPKILVVISLTHARNVLSFYKFYMTGKVFTSLA